MIASLSLTWHRMYYTMRTAGWLVEKDCMSLNASSTDYRYSRYITKHISHCRKSGTTHLVCDWTKPKSVVCIWCLLLSEAPKMHHLNSGNIEAESLRFYPSKTKICWNLESTDKWPQVLQGSHSGKNWIKTKKFGSPLYNFVLSSLLSKTLFNYVSYIWRSPSLLWFASEHPLSSHFHP